MLLSADSQLALDAQRARFERRDVAARNAQRLGEKAAGFDRLLDRQDRGQRLVLDRHTPRSPLRRLERFAENPGDGLVVEHHFIGKQRLVVAIRPAVSLPGNIGVRSAR